MRIQYLKHPDTPHWSHDPMIVLGEDEWGLWLGATPDTWFHKGLDGDPGADPPTSFGARRPTLQLLVPNAWWTLVRNDGGRYPWYVDVVVPPAIDGDVATMVDLDLDVIRTADGTVFVDDEDEFDHHRDLLGYPERWVDQARVTAARLVLDLERLAEPFDRVADAWLETLRGHWERPDR